MSCMWCQVQHTSLESNASSDSLPGGSNGAGRQDAGNTTHGCFREEIVWLSREREQSSRKHVLVWSEVAMGGEGREGRSQLYKHWSADI